MPSSSERLDFLYVSLVGQIVVVHTVDGEATEGLFTARSEEGIQLAHTRSRCTARSGPTSESETYAVLRIAMDNIVWIDVAAVRLEAAASGKVERFQGQTMERLDWAQMGVDDQDDDFEEEARNHKAGSFDQFKTNKEKFGVKSTYDESLYTTKLDKTKLTEEQINHATRVASEIDASAARGGVQHRVERGEDLDIDEGDLYSNVARGPDRSNNNNNAKKGAAPTSSTNNTTMPSNKENAAASGGNGASTTSAASPSSTSKASLNANAKGWTPTFVPVPSNAILEIASKVDRNPWTSSSIQQQANNEPTTWGTAVDPYGMEDRQAPSLLNNNIAPPHHQQPSQFAPHHHHQHHHHVLPHHAMQVPPQQQQQQSGYGGGAGSYGQPPQPSFHHHQPQQPPVPLPTVPQPTESATRVQPARGGMGPQGGLPRAGPMPATAQPQQPVAAGAKPLSRGANRAPPPHHQDPQPQQSAPMRGGKKN